MADPDAPPAGAALAPDEMMADAEGAPANACPLPPPGRLALCGSSPRIQLALSSLSQNATRTPHRPGHLGLAPPAQQGPDARARCRDTALPHRDPLDPAQRAGTARGGDGRRARTWECQRARGRTACRTTCPTQAGSRSFCNTRPAWRPGTRWAAGQRRRDTASPCTAVRRGGTFFLPTELFNSDDPRQTTLSTRMREL